MKDQNITNNVFAKNILPNTKNFAKSLVNFNLIVPHNFNIAEVCCERWAKLDPNRIAIKDITANSKKSWTFFELNNASNKLASVFKKNGISKGDRIAILLQQSPEVMITHFAAYKVGAVVVPLFTLFGPDALLYRLNDSGSKILITDKFNLNKVLNIKLNLNYLKMIFCKNFDSDATISLWKEIKKAKPLEKKLSISKDDPAIIIYTSGTTGDPKGVLHAHRFLLGHLPNIEVSHDGFPKKNDCGWTPADWAWIGGLMDLALPCLYYGVKLICYRTQKFDPKKAWKLIHNEKVRNLFLPPTALKLMKKEKIPKNISIRSIASGGEPLGDELIKWGKKHLGLYINEIYGQTECNLVVSSCRSLEKTPKGTMGKTVPGHKIVILDKNKNRLPPNEIGEISIFSPHPVMFLKYWNKPKETKKKFFKNWLLTGDLGKIDESGFITFISRNDDIINSSGYRINPTEIENCLMKHDSVVMSAVIGVPDKKRTEVIKAFVVSKIKTPRLKEELISFVKFRLSPHLAPKEIEWKNELPMTATGKIMRKKLKDKELVLRELK